MPAWVPSSAFWQWVGYWQTLLAGMLAIAAGAGTIWATIASANREVEAANLQIRMARKQIDMMLAVERQRILSEARAFFVALGSACKLANASADAALTIARITRHAERSVGTIEAYHARQRLLCPLFPEVRAACVRLGGDLAPIFLQLDQEASAFSEDWLPAQAVSGMPMRLGAEVGFLDGIERIKEISAKLADAAHLSVQQCDEHLRELDQRLDVHRSNQD